MENFRTFLVIVARMWTIQQYKCSGASVTERNLQQQKQKIPSTCQCNVLFPKYISQHGPQAPWPGCHSQHFGHLFALSMLCSSNTGHDVRECRHHVRTSPCVWFPMWSRVIWSNPNLDGTTLAKVLAAHRDPCHCDLVSNSTWKITFGCQ